MLYTNDAEHAFDGMPPYHSNEPPRHDILVVLWRWKWLPIVGALLGMVVGVLNFSRQKPTYESFALIQVVYPNAETAGIEPVSNGPIRFADNHGSMSRGLL